MNKIQKILSITLLISFLLSSTTKTTYAYLETKNENPKIYVDARSAIAVDSNTGIVLFEKNSKELTAIASTTKIITCLVALNYGNLDKKIEISNRSASIRGSQIGYKKGEKITLRELLYGLMLKSGNDAAIAIAEGIAGSVEDFAKLMNEYAAEIGMRDSHFESPHGLDSKYHYSTAYDLAIATSKAKQFKLFNNIVSTKDIDASKYGFSRSYHNINKILYELHGANGVKTGYTGRAGKCLVTSVNFNGNDVIIVTLNCTPRWRETKKIYKYICDNYGYKKFVNKGEILDEVNILNSNESAKLICNKDIIIPVRKGSKYFVEILKPKYEVFAPLKRGTQIGTLQIVKDNKIITREPLIAKDEIKEDKSLIRKIKKFRIIKWILEINKSKNII